MSKTTTFQDVPGLGPASIEKLEEAGYTTVLSVAVASLGQIVTTTGITEKTARKIIQHCRDNSGMTFITATQALEKREQVQRISTGSQNFDKLMGGGFETGSIVECYGEFGSSKTQIAHLLAVNCQKDDPTAIAIYIDSEGSFRPERIKQFAKGAGLDPEKVLENIRVAKAYNTDHQMLLAEQITELIDKEQLNAKLVVIDSLTAHFRSEYIGRGTLAERQQKLNRHLSALGKLADMKNLCIYVTNQVMVDPAQFFGDPTKSVGGHILAHKSTFRVYLRKGKKGSRVAKLVDAPNLPDGEINFMVLEGGLEDL